MHPRQKTWDGVVDCQKEVKKTKFVCTSRVRWCSVSVNRGSGFPGHLHVLQLCCRYSFQTALAITKFFHETPSLPLCLTSVVQSIAQTSASSSPPSFSFLQPHLLSRLISTIILLFSSCLQFFPASTASPASILLLPCFHLSPSLLPILPCFHLFSFPASIHLFSFPASIHLLLPCFASSLLLPCFHPCFHLFSFPASIPSLLLPCFHLISSPSLLPCFHPCFHLFSFPASISFPASSLLLPCFHLFSFPASSFPASSILLASTSLSPSLLPSLLLPASISSPSLLPSLLLPASISSPSLLPHLFSFPASISSPSLLPSLLLPCFHPSPASISSPSLLPSLLLPCFHLSSLLFHPCFLISSPSLLPSLSLFPASISSHSLLHHSLLPSLLIPCFHLFSFPASISSHSLLPSLLIPCFHLFSSHFFFPSVSHTIPLLVTSHSPLLLLHPCPSPASFFLFIFLFFSPSDLAASMCARQAGCLAACEGPLRHIRVGFLVGGLCDRSVRAYGFECTRVFTSSCGFCARVFACVFALVAARGGSSLALSVLGFGLAFCLRIARRDFL
ncbi:hypothetical protein C7M84_010339 [Penaeus vannamei]|uniref:Uncharacterized protein n=1 Tax=Penaeus vannamei TaxID=6689 RepID=A0A3R7MAC8_PENVA|nr:hypothetical protein C7M84_010339 [Penaeus vannamei]